MRVITQGRCWKTIVPSKKVGFHINALKARQFANRNKRTLCIIYACDTLNGSRIRSPQILQRIRETLTVPGNNGLRYIEIAVGSKIMITQNQQILTQYRITNGNGGLDR